MYTITPMTRVKVLVDGEEPDTLAIATLIYDLFSIGNDSFDLANLTGQLAKTGRCHLHFMPSYSGQATIRLA